MSVSVQALDATQMWRDRAREFLNGLPQDQEGAERALAMRALIADAADSVDRLCLLCAVYQLFAEGNARPYSVHDAHMVVSSVTERLELLPILDSYLERFLDRSGGDSSHLRGLWLYVRELYMLRQS